ncbi:MAG TPA: winged helix-turn-helix transcriptional regulator, partial [Cytophagaceae bacterium]
MEENLEIDNIDKKILSLLLENATMPYTEIAKKVHVSGGTVHVRMKKMEDMGIVRGSQLKVDYSKLGFDITAFLGIYLERSSFYDEAVSGLLQIPEIVDVHYT